MFIDLDYNKRLKNAKIYLAKPTVVVGEKIIEHISEKFGMRLNVKQGDVSELEFSIPFYIEDNHSDELIFNENVNRIKEKMYIKVTMEGYQDWFVVEDIDESGEEQNIFRVKCYSLGYELKYKRISALNYEAEKLSVILTELLKNTTWNVGYIHPVIDTMFRNFESGDNSNILDCIFNLAEAFKGLVKWDNESRTVSFHSFAEDGSFKGLTVTERKLMNSIERSRTSGEMITRLYVRGDEDLDISGVNPTGMPYIEDFSYYIHPFERDGSGNTIRGSDYMSDALCHALLDHEEAVALHTPDIINLQNQLETKTTQIITEQSLLADLELELDNILQLLDIAKATDDSALITQRENERDAKELEVSNQQSVVNGLQNDIDSINNQINQKKSLISHESNMTQNLLDELSLFIHSGEWKDDRYTDAQELYDDGLKKFEERQQPKVVIETSIANFLNSIDEQYYWDKLILGDLIKVKHKPMKIEYMAKIIGMEFDIDNEEIVLQIANTKDLLDSYDKLIALLYSNKSASSTLQNNKYKWDRVEYVQTEIESIIQNEWDATKRRITAGANNSIEIGNRGIIVSSPDYPNEVVIIQSGVIALSEDYGETWKTAIRGYGIIAERLIGRIIAGSNLLIETQDGSFKVDDNGVVISGTSLTITDGGISEGNINSTSTQKWNSAEANAIEYTNTQISQVNQATSDLQDSLNEFSSDSKITLAEANSLEVQLQQVNKESEDLISVANGLSITTEKNNYSTALTELTTYLNNNWLNQVGYPLDILSTDRIDINTKFKNVQNTKSILINKITDVQSQDGKYAWSKFSGANDTLPAGNVEFNFAGSNSQGGNATNTDNVGNQSAGNVQDATINFNDRNDRIGVIPNTPTIETNGVAIDHTLEDNASANISFEWNFNSTGDAGKIDGFIVYMKESSSSAQQTLGSANDEQVYYVTPEKRSFIVYGVSPNKYYSFGVRSYRIVDPDINANEVLMSTIAQPSLTAENPYQPSSSVSFNGNVTGTIDGRQAKSVADQADNSLQEGQLYNGVKIDTTSGLVVTRTDDKARTTVNATDGIKIEGRPLSTDSWSNKFYVDTSGNLIAESMTANNMTANNMTANDIVINGGTISWSNVSAPSYSQITGSKPPSNADVTETVLTSTSVYAPYLETNLAYVRGTLTADHIDATSLEVQAANITGVLSADKIDSNISQVNDYINMGQKTLFGYSSGRSSMVMLRFMNPDDFQFIGYNVYIGENKIDDNRVATRGWVQSNAVAKFG